ncbi:MAG: uroporphyrinogen-III synthase, partial [Bacteroidota bacterium]
METKNMMQRMEVLNGQTYVEKYLKVKSILVSQPKPERSPYYELEKKYGLQIDWRPFIHVEPVNIKDYRRQRIPPEEFGAVILTSKNAVDHFFRTCEETRVKMSEDTKYFCLTEAVANYLQKFIVYRKRKVFSGNRTILDLKSYLMKHRDKEKFLLPCSNLGGKEVTKFLQDNKFNFQESVMYQTVASDLSDLKDIYYDVIVFFSPMEI